MINWYDSITFWTVRVANKQIRGGVGGGQLSFDVLETHHRVTLYHILEDLKPGYNMSCYTFM